MTRNQLLEGIYNEGTRALEKGDLDTALVSLRRVAHHATDPDLSARSWANLGVGLKRLGDQTAALNAFNEALVKDPDAYAARFNLANTLFALGQHGESLAEYAKIRERFPHKADIPNNMGKVFMALGRAKDAEQCFQAAIEIDPENASVWGNLANAQAANGRKVAPIRSTQTALKLSPDRPRFLIQLGHLMAEQGHLSVAQRSFSRVLSTNPNHLPATVGLAQVWHRTGKNQVAYDLLLPFIQEGPHSPNLAAIWAQICRQLGRPDDAIEILKGQIELATELPTLSLLQYSLGDLLDLKGQYDDAWAAYCSANLNREPAFDPEVHRKWVDKIIAQPIPTNRSTIESEMPIFIVGMPRSGTSLVEQVLARHPSVFGAGELDDIAQMTILASHAVGGTYPEALGQLTSDQFEKLAETYLHRLQIETPDAVRVTDKMPQNFLYLGLVSGMFPRARVIHCKRNMIDAGLSCFFQNFKNTLAFSIREDWIVSWAEDYERLMAHWAETLPLPILDVPYEDLCRSPEEWSRRIVDFAGLEWSPACLEPHRSGRVVRTASFAQVRRPIYQTSIDRSQPYRKHFSSLLRLQRQTKA